MQAQTTLIWMPRPQPARRLRRARRIAGLLTAMPLLIGFTMLGKPSGLEPGVVISAAPMRFDDAPKPQPAKPKPTAAKPVVKAKESEARLPSPDERLPAMDSEDFARRVRRLGIDPNEVRQFAKMMED